MEIMILLSHCKKRYSSVFYRNGTCQGVWCGFQNNETGNNMCLCLLCYYSKDIHVFQESHVRDSSLHISPEFSKLLQWLTSTKTLSFCCRLTSTVHWRSLNQICYWFIQTVVHITHLNIMLGEIVNKYLSTSIRNTINWWLNFNRYVLVMTLSHSNIPAVIKSCAIFWPPDILNKHIIWYDFRVSPTGFGNVIFSSLCLFYKTIGKKLALIKVSLQITPWYWEHKLWGCHPLVQMKVSIVYLL